MLNITTEQYKQLTAVNKDINKAVIYRTDQAQYGVLDKWVLPDRYGDCDDYVLAKRAKLIKHGWDPLELKICICYTEEGIGHAILMIDTQNRGTLVLDNRYNEVKTHKELKRIGYQFVKRQQGTAWVSIK